MCLAGATKSPGCGSLGCKKANSRSLGDFESLMPVRSPLNAREHEGERRDIRPPAAAEPALGCLNQDIDGVSPAPDVGRCRARIVNNSGHIFGGALTDKGVFKPAPTRFVNTHGDGQAP